MMEGVAFKLSSFQFIKLNPKSRSSVSIPSGFRRFSSSVFVSASITEEEGDQLVGSLSLGHWTRTDFPILNQEVNGSKLVYLDNAATSQKPNAVIKALQNYYEAYNSNVHRGVHHLSARETDEYELARKKVAAFINASDSREIVFTRNATEAINLVSYTWGLSNLKPGDEIIVTVAEHHSAIVPWQLVAQKTGAVLRFVSLNEDEVPDAKELKEMLSEKTKLVAVHHVSNMLARIRVCPVGNNTFSWRKIVWPDDPSDVSFLDEEEILLEERDGVSFNVCGKHDSDYESDPEEELGWDEKTDPEEKLDPNEEIKRQVVMADLNESDPEEKIKQKTKTKNIIDPEQEFDRMDKSEHEMESERNPIKVEVKKDKHLCRQPRTQRQFVKLYDERKTRSKESSMVLFTRKNKDKKFNFRRGEPSYNSRRHENRSEYGSSFYVGPHYRQLKRSSTSFTDSTHFYADRKRFSEMATRRSPRNELISYPASKRSYSTMETSPTYFADTRVNHLKDCYGYEKYERARKRGQFNNNYERRQIRGWGEYHGKSNAQFTDNHVYRSRLDYDGGSVQPMDRRDFNIYQRDQSRVFSNYEISQTNFRVCHNMAYEDKMFIQSNTNEYPKFFKY